MEEHIFFEDKNTKITNTRFVVSNQTYAMSSVNSVKVIANDITPSKNGAMIVGVIGILFLAMHISNAPSTLGGYVFPTTMLAWSTYWLKSIKTQYEHIIVLTTSSGEMSALKNNDEVYIKNVEKSLIQAIVHRG